MHAMRAVSVVARRRLPSRALGVALLSGLLLFRAPAAAEDAALETDFESVLDEDRRILGSDPSEIVSRLEVRNEFLHVDGGHSDATIFRGDWAPTHWLLGRVEIPLVAADFEESGSDFGLGDVLVGVRGKAMLAEHWSLIGEMAAFLDTATSEPLGTGSNVLAPQAVLVWKPSPPWILGLQV
ncbi:MAG: hypothetical protein ACKO2K_21360, partial [Alphaproteobacteria bacterium]